MNAGLPATGIGGFFYILMAFVMPFTEIFRTFQGKSSLSRWVLVLKQLSIAAGIIFGVDISGMLVKNGLALGAKTASGAGVTSPVVNNSYSIVIPLSLSFVTLLLVLLTVRVAEFFFARSFVKEALD